ncbi:MAG: hypothetical protein M0T82_05250 [Desulfobacteraceae bacterium]|nr:hypothetical protein [Desulfobacteraceae bacterium]
MDEKTLRELEKTLTEKFPAGIPRPQLGKATGNLLHPRTQANLDCTGAGIKGRYRVGRLIVYPVSGVIDFLKSKIEVVNA